MSEYLSILREEARDLLASGEVYGAYNRLAETYQIDRRFCPSDELPALEPPIQAKLSSAASSRVEKALRVLAYGDSWESEEVLLVATITVQLQHLLEFLRDRYCFELDVDDRELTERISELRQESKFNSQWLAAEQRIQRRLRREKSKYR